jgi:hypothetical protein
MTTILHILTRGTDELSQRIIEAQRALPDTRIEVMDLPPEGADYTAVVENIFASDSIEVW